MQEYIPIDLFCHQHGVEISFISSLQDFGLLYTTRIDEIEYIAIAQLAEAERLVRLYGELDINIQGIDVIIQLLQRLSDRQTEIQQLKNRLSQYEYLG